MSDLLDFLGITDENTWRQWVLKNHPDKGGDNDKFVKVKAAWENRQLQSKTNPNSNTVIDDTLKQTIFNIIGLDKRHACYGMTSFGKHCAQDVIPGTKLCNKHSSGCHYILPSEDRQCNKVRRADDVFCELHSTKPRQHKPKPQIYTCSYIKADGSQCKAKSQNKYCYRHGKQIVP